MRELIIVGLGPGGIEQLSCGAWNTLKNAREIYLRTARHPVVQELAAGGISYEAFDSLYERNENFRRFMTNHNLCKTNQKNRRCSIWCPSAGEKTVHLL